MLGVEVAAAVGRFDRGSPPERLEARGLVPSHRSGGAGQSGRKAEEFASCSALLVAHFQEDGSI